MTPVYDDGQVVLHMGDCLDVLASMDEASVDAVVYLNFPEAVA